jgi:hypothetical protein
MNIIHSSTLALFTNSFVKIYWLFIHPVLGLFIYSRSMETDYSLPSRERKGESIYHSITKSKPASLQATKAKEKHRKGKGEMK